MSTKRTHLYLLHGWAVNQQNADKWQPFIAALEKRNFQTTFLGLPGLTTPLDEVWGLGDYVDWLAKKLPSEKVILVGHSFGGQLAIRFASLYPERVAQLILIDSSGIRDHSLMARTKRLVFKGIARLGKQVSHSPLLRRWLYILARERDYYEASPLLRKTMARVVADEVHADLPKISVKTLLIWGSEDKVTPIKNAYLKQSLIHRSQLTVIPGARHSPHFTHPEIVAERIVAFTD